MAEIENKQNCQLEVGLYKEAKKDWPIRGRHILAHYDDDTIVVYQAYNNKIADYAVTHKKFAGCPQYSETRMTWVKTNFLWMQYRSDWGRKHSQERTLAIWLKREAFEEILYFARESNSVLRNEARKKKGSSSKEEHDEEETDVVAQSKSNKGEKLKTRRSVRLQWDPDHTPSGGKALFRKAVQLGIKGVKEYSDGSWIVDIQDITPFVREQSQNTAERRLDELKVPIEKVFYPSDPDVATRIRLDKDFKTERDSSA